MNKLSNTWYLKKKRTIFVTLALLSLSSFCTNAAITLEKEVKVTDKALFFDGVKKSSVKAALNDPDVGSGQYDYIYGPAISPHGDAIKTYKHYVFMTWYQGGKYNRHVKLTRYNTKTGKSKTIEFPHRHTGFQNRWWIGETHNTIAVGISPKDGSIHLLYDMHGYSASKPDDGKFAQDYFRYSYSKANAASVSDDKFTLSQFVNNKKGQYKHLKMPGTAPQNSFIGLTYPRFFLNDEGDLFMHMRKGSDKNGKITFIKYDGNAKWGRFKDFNATSASNRGEQYNWGIYGSMKYVDGKVRIGFQRRLDNRSDKYVHQNGFYYAYSDDPTGQNKWKNYQGTAITMPVVDASKVFVSEPGNLVKTKEKDKASIVGGFDWTVTDNGDVHIIGKVRDNEFKKTVNVHTYQKAGTSKFVTSTKFSGADNIYTSNDKIYIIGLRAGRPFIEQAQGGTNNFSTVYQGDDKGREFSKGIVHINNGKLYYYLLEKGTGDKRTTYLQIINLDLDSSGPEGFSFAANERGTVEVEGTVDIAYGAKGQFYYLYGQTSNVACTNTVFGDPISSTPKQCFIKKADNSFVHIAKASATGFAIDGGSKGKAGQNVKFWSSRQSNINQQWEEIRLSGDFYQYKKRDTNFCLDGGNKGKTGQNVVLKSCVQANKNQHWKKVSRGGKNYQLKKRNQDFSLNGANNKKGGNVNLSKTVNKKLSNQVFTFTTINN